MFSLLLVVLLLGVVSARNEPEMWLTPQGNKAWDFYQKVSGEQSDKIPFFAERAEQQMRPFASKSLSLGEQSQLIKNLAEEEGLHTFAATFERAKQFDQSLLTSNSPSALTSFTQSPIPGSPGAARPAAPNMLSIQNSFTQSGTLFRDMIAKQPDFTQQFISSENLLLEYEKTKSLKYNSNNHDKPTQKLAGREGPTLVTNNFISFLQWSDNWRAGRPSAPNDPSLTPTNANSPNQPSNTGAVMAFHLLPYLLRSTYGTYKDLANEEGLKLFGPDYTKLSENQAKVEPLRTSSNGILPKETYKGYDGKYYEALQNTKPLKLWWNYKGKTPPPWFTNNPPPNRAHFMRSPIPVPKPPFKSPFNKHMFATGYFQQKPQPWPLLHHPMVQGVQPGDGSMKCPCPNNPMMMCDCNSVNYVQDPAIAASLRQAQLEASGKVNFKSDWWEQIENAAVENLLTFPNLEVAGALYNKP